ncbi:HrpE/YscL family type III secretion apparatus protein [Massiliimalia massiliensis]|uniref:HrpE/YscL family type III secretion apparatus protein n=1 Tax=Massiliimalia massiliensis TaxID=1852384 RepID=UPI000985FF8B|nr:HrpE/YscL family type III secretion apparatus protein [Massiliimalia massiliensis]
MNINEILDIMDDMLESAWSVPLSGGKCVIEVDRFGELIDDIRLNLPQEIKQAKLIVTDRKIIIEDAKKEAEGIVKAAEERARRLVDENEINKKAKAQANEVLSTAQTQARELKRAANEFSESVLKNTEQGLLDAVNQIKTAKSALRSPNGLKK